MWWWGPVTTRTWCARPPSGCGSDCQDARTLSCGTSPRTSSDGYGLGRTSHASSGSGLQTRAEVRRGPSAQTPESCGSHASPLRHTLRGGGRATRCCNHQINAAPALLKGPCESSPRRGVRIHPSQSSTRVARYRRDGLDVDRSSILAVPPRHEVEGRPHRGVGGRRGEGVAAHLIRHLCRLRTTCDTACGEVQHLAPGVPLTRRRPGASNWF
jgi:hypothetical protein